MRRLRRAGPLVLMLLCALHLAEAVPAPVRWTLDSAGARRPVRPGERLTLTLRAAIEPGWYLYGISQAASGPAPLRITIPSGQPWAVDGAITGTSARKAWDAAFEAETARHAGTVAFRVPVRVAPTAPAGSAMLVLHVRYQVCSDTICLRPKTGTLSMELEIRRAVASAEPKEERW